MSSLSEIVERVKGFQLDALLGLRPPYPPVAVELDRSGAAMVRLKPKRRGKPTLEAHAVCELPEQALPESIFQTGSGKPEEIAESFRQLFDRTGTRPGRVSLILPDNLAKISMITLPERPASPRQLDELVRARMRRSVPFRLDEATLSYQLIPGEGKQVGLLVLVAPRALVEQYEKGLELTGARVGLIDVSTPNLINLCHDTLSRLSRGGKDAALLNCASNYFTLVIVRDERLIFFRCKTFAPSAPAKVGGNGLLVREIAGSLSYYQEKLSGKRIEGLLVRSVHEPFEAIAEKLRPLDLPKIEPIAPLDSVELPAGGRLEPAVADRLAPALGAAAARGR